MAYLVTIVVVPLLFDRLGPPLAAGSRRVNRRLEKGAERLADWTLRHRYAVLAGGVVVVVGAVVSALGVRAESYLFESFPEDDPVVRANRALEQDFPGIVPFAVVVCDPRLIRRKTLNARNATANTRSPGRR